MYGGRFFRSRLEARWAVFFDRISIPWIYEPEGYQFPNGHRYLPDFYLPKLDCFIEIKPCRPNRREIDNCHMLAMGTKKRVYLFYGNVGYRDYPSGQEISDNDTDSAWMFDPADSCVAEDYSYFWCVCRTCDKYGIEYEGRSDRICRHSLSDRGHNPDDERLLHAYDLANQARF